jgi:2-polyprenyl-3-methyl-5-hydroxy-6-metoxy-1,4-benzoquinol methylase
MLTANEAVRITPTSVKASAREFARSFAGLRRVLTAWRPAICPFDRVLEQVPESSRVLDIGCGSGLLLFLLFKHGRLASGDGVEVSEEMVEAARRALAKTIGDRAAVTVRLITSEHDWPRDAYDVVTVIDVMHHVPAARQHTFFSACVERIRMGGLLVYKDMCRRPRWRAAANQTHDLVLARQWINYRPIAEIESWAQQASMQLLRSDEVAMLWYGHEMRVFQKQPS